MDFKAAHLNSELTISAFPQMLFPFLYKVYLFFLSFRRQEGIELNLNYSMNTRGSAFYPLLESSAWQAEREEINTIFLSEGRERERYECTCSSHIPSSGS